MPARPEDPDWLKAAYAEGRITEVSTNAGRLVMPGQSAAEPATGTTEQDFQDEIIHLARSFGWRVAHFRSVRIARSDGTTYWATPVQADGEGFLDLILVRERVIYAELKTNVGVVSPQQKAWFQCLKAANQEVYLWRPKDWQVIIAILAFRASAAPTAATSPSRPVASSVSHSDASTS